jgi:hypothetical protein
MKSIGCDFRRGNHSLWPHHPNHVRNVARRQRIGFSYDAFQRFGRLQAEHSMSGILWLASYPKSGNTWLRAFLANYFQNGSTPISINALPNYAFGDNFLIHYQRQLNKPDEVISDDDTLRLRRSVHCWFATSRTQTVFVKTHSIVGKVGDVPLITPDATAGAVYVVRHPFDIAVSWAYHYRTHLDHAVDALCRTANALPRGNSLLVQYLGSWAEHVHSWTTAPGLTRHVMRYEDMQTRPRTTFAALVSFLQLPPDLERLKRAIRFSCFRELAAQEQRDGFVEARPDGSTRFFREGCLGTGITILSRAQRLRLCEALGEVMHRHGYDEKGAAMEWDHAS